MKLHHKTPISLVLTMLLNIVLIVIFELLVLYRFPAPPTEEMLAEIDSRYKNCSAITDANTGSNRIVRFYAVKTASGETDLVPMKQHSFVPSRTKLLTRKILKNLDLDENGTETVAVGTNFYTIFISDGVLRVGATGGGSFQQATLSKYLGLGMALALLELLIWDKLRGNACFPLR